MYTRALRRNTRSFFFFSSSFALPRYTRTRSLPLGKQHLLSNLHTHTHIHAHGRVYPSCVYPRGRVVHVYIHAATRERKSKVGEILRRARKTLDHSRSIIPPLSFFFSSLYLFPETLLPVRYLFFLYMYIVPISFNLYLCTFFLHFSRRGMCSAYGTSLYFPYFYLTSVN